jgi:hypothetical protein
MLASVTGRLTPKLAFDLAEALALFGASAASGDAEEGTHGERGRWR